MKRTLTGIVAASMVLGSFAPAALAATSSKTQWQYNTLEINGKAAISNVPSTVYQNTTYISVYDMQQYLNKLGYKATWNVNTMNVTVSGSPDLSSLPQTSGNAIIQVNGKTAMKVNHIVAQPTGWSQKSSFVPIYDFQLLLDALGINQKWDGATHTWSATTAPQADQLAITGAPTSDVAVGQQVSLGLTNDGSAVTDGVTWTTGNGAVVNNGNFIASAPGTYTVTATYGGKTATASVVVYGQPAGVKLTAQSANLVADGNSTDTITATVVDSNGNTVGNYNGTVTISGANASDVTDMNGKPLGGTLQITNGVGQFQLTTTSGDAGADLTAGSVTLSTSALSNAPSGVNISYGSATVNFVSPTATALGLTIASGAPSISVNSGNGPANVNLALNDASGVAVSGASAEVTLTLSGPGSFSPTSTVTSEVVPASGGTNPISVYGEEGQAGTITLTASATGYQSATLNIPAVINTSAAGLSVTSTSTTDANGNPATIYTVSLVDTKGQVIATNSVDNISVTPDFGTTGGSVNYFAVSDGKVTGSGSATAPTLTLTNGVATFAVETATEGSGPVTFKFQDSTEPTLSSATATYNFQAGPAYEPGWTTATSNLAGGSMQAGQSQTFSVQLEDANGNPVKEAGQKVTFTLANGGTSAQLPNGNTSGTYTVTTDANGVAALTVNVPSSSNTGSFTVQASYNNGTSTQNSTTLTTNVVSAASYISKLAWASTPTASAETATAGAAFMLPNVDLENSLGEQENTSDTFTVTTSNPNVVALQNTSGVADPNTNSAGTQATVTVSGANSFALPALTAEQAGTATITIQDVSNPTMPSLSITLTSTKGMFNSDVVEYNGQAVNGNNPLSTTANTPVELTVVHADKGGNPVMVTGTAGSGDWVSLSDGGKGGSFTLTPGGAPVSEVEIPVGQSSVNVYYVNPATTSVDTFTATDNQNPPVNLANSSMTASGTTATAGSDVTYTLVLKDASGNPVTGQASHIAIDVLEGTPADVTLSPITESSPGTYTFTVSDTKAETMQIGATYNGANFTTPEVTVGAIPATITSAAYDHTTGVLTITGTGFATTGSGAIDPSKLTLSDGTGSVTLSATDSVSIVNSTTVEVTLSSAEQTAVTGGTIDLSTGTDTLNAAAGFATDQYGNTTGTAETGATLSYN